MAFAIRREATAFANDRSGKETASFKDAAHLAFIRKLPSAVSGQMPCEAAHIRTGSARHNKKKTGGSQKSSDCWTLPLTADEHRAQHDANELDWWRSHGIDPFELAIKLYEVSGDVVAGTEIIRKAKP